jgi:Flp pilus assembly protein TadD
VQLTFAEKIGDGGVQRGTPIPDSEAHAYLAELVAATGRPDEAKRQLERVLEPTPLAPRALSALGTIELGAGNIDMGMSLLERAGESAPEDSWVQSALGRALADRLLDARGDREAHEAKLSRARTILSKAVGLPPASASTLVALALVELEGNNLQHARSLLEEASRMAPAREPYRALLAQVLMSQGEFDAADGILGPLAATGTRHEVREDARSLLVRVATLRLRSVARADPVGARGAPASGPVATSPMAGAQPAVGDTPESLSETSARPGVSRLVLNLRAVGPGETRVRADFRAVDCTAAGIVLRVNVNGKVLRFAAVNLTDIDFVSFRSDTPASVACGLFAPMSALVTYRPSPPVLAHLKAEGEVVAVELIPQDYVPRHP